MTAIQKGKIIGFKGSWLSGLAQLIVVNEKGEHKSIPCDNAPTVRALNAAFGNVIASGHTVNQDAIKDKEIYYSVGFVLEGFTPVEMASEELIETYEKQSATQQ